ncbi:MAG: MmgE/PrpD family protein [Alphaproteobacteria bacterium]|jgi:2-methylcitrate dehydratase PrpD|nr:MmgE/PrpD family protein [Alphaproteobacteria bacterium]
MAETDLNDDLTRAFAEDLTQLGGGDLSATDREQISRLILDHLGVCLRGSDLPWGRSLVEWGARMRGNGPCVVFGAGYKSVPAVAALINATAAHGMELDDTHDSSVTHPGAVVIATALAVGTSEERSSGDIMAAIAAGYETMGRIGRATGAADIIEHGFHPTALFGGFGAATTAAKLMGMDAERLTRAWGLMLSMAGGSMQFSQDPVGTTVKRLHGGYGAHNGTMAAEFARLGIDGPSQAFDGVYGLCNIFGRSPDVSELTNEPDAPLEIHNISLKPYPCCRLFHSTIDALRDVTAGFTVPAEQISAIRIGGPEIMVTQHMMRRPTSVMAAQYSLPFTMGASLAFEPSDYAAYEENNLNNAAILDVADKVEAVSDADLDAVFPAHFGSWVELVAHDGSVRRADVLDSYGTPARPMPVSAIEEKVAGLIAPLADAPDVSQIAARVAAFCDEEAGGLENLVNLFHQDG